MVQLRLGEVLLVPGSLEDPDDTWWAMREQQAPYVANPAPRSAFSGPS